MSSEALTKIQAVIVVVAIVCAVVAGISAWWISKREVSPPFELQENAVGIDIVVEAEGMVFHYREELFWSENQFSEIMENQNEFGSNLIENFNESLSTYGERNEHAVDANVEFDEARKSIILTCNIHGAMISNDYFTFRWLLDRLGLDFIDNNFQESVKGLYWEGFVDDVPVTITLSFPFPIAHCHAHVNVWVFTDGSVKKRSGGYHTLLMKEIQALLKGEPETIVIGTGTAGCVKIDSAAKQLA